MTNKNVYSSIPRFYVHGVVGGVRSTQDVAGVDLADHEDEGFVRRLHRFATSGASVDTPISIVGVREMMRDTVGARSIDVDVSVIARESALDNESKLEDVSTIDLLRLFVKVSDDTDVSDCVTRCARGATPIDTAYHPSLGVPIVQPMSAAPVVPDEFVTPIPEKLSVGS